MQNHEFIFELDPLRQAMCKAYRMDEQQAVEQLLRAATISPAAQEKIQATARKLVVDVRKKRIGKAGLDAFLSEYDLSSEEGVALMCLAEAMLRIPDSVTIDKLIKDKIGYAAWDQHLGKSKSTFVNATTWALMLTGKIVSPQSLSANNLTGALQRLAKRGGEPIIRAAVGQAMKILGRQFVMGQSIEEAISLSDAQQNKGYRYSYDMLGEESCTAKDAEAYYASYMHAIETLGQTSTKQGVYARPGISIKLSALHPRYEWRKRERVVKELLPKLRDLAIAAKRWDLGFTIDAEEAERLDLSLDLFELLIADPQLKGWRGLGMAVQAYQKRAPLVIDFLVALAQQHQTRIMIRLVKGAYWDAEVKVAQERGLSGYPVFTRKISTDVSYIVCVKKIFAATDELYPQFATHNAYSVALVLELAENYRDFEFQCLHGMGDALYANIVGEQNLNIPCRIYAPVGTHQSLLAYLVRRLLENGANTSFVNRIIDERAAIDDLIADPVVKLRDFAYKPHAKIPLPENLYGEGRPNSHGIDFTNPLEYVPTLKTIYQENKVASIEPTPADHIEEVLRTASDAAKKWGNTEPQHRVQILQRMAILLEQNKAIFMALLVHEAHKTINDAMSEVREAIDFCWYYAQRTMLDFPAQVLHGPTGELDQIKLHGRGVIACISPWNFPLAIFLGQVSAALLAGNAVIAKPAGQTAAIAAKAIELLIEAGVPNDVVHLVVGSGAIVGEALVNDLRVNGVMFTGSTETAWHINRALANRRGPIVPFVAETGGQNAMIVDSSALPEQVVKDVLISAFGSAGQRCSSLRVLFVQEETADRLIEMLCGAMAEIRIGDPQELSTDVGPVIDQSALAMLNKHRTKMQQTAKLLYEVQLPADLPAGNYFAPVVFEIGSITELEGEVFGPILHVVRYKAADLDQVIEDINNTGYGLTMGIHSRIDETVEYILQRSKVGNVYVNRNMIGAVVGVQPFGGEGLSGTGPKAGGPHYLARLAIERVVSINTAAAGGNATLMSLQE